MPALLELTVATALVLGPAPGEVSSEVAGAASSDETEAANTDAEDRNALGVRSQQGTRRGALEFGLGSLLSAT
ncbi:MAG: hypothetical protein KC431_03390, partial [Myxococcales bacterium]|nr:hypothetical protein [Myxococcales bacterium]